MFVGIGIVLCLVVLVGIVLYGLCVLMLIVNRNCGGLLFLSWVRILFVML